jgi:NAD-dependent dihydropyrimidine dehydrogenase PreA subunit
MAIETVNEVYNELAEAWCLKGSKSFIKLAEVWFTPEEAKVLSKLSWWMTPTDLAKKLKADEAFVNTTLENLVKKGWVRRRENTVNAGPNLGAPFPQMAPPGVPVEKFNQLWVDFYRGGDNQNWIVDKWLLRLEATGHAVHRVIPATKALRASPNLKPQDILWYEDMDQILARAKRISGARGKNACGCRKTWGVCESPIGCMGWSFDDKPMRMGPSRKELSVEEAKAMVAEAEEYGNVNVPPNLAMTEVTCFCCPCCCHCLSPGLNYGKPYKGYGKVQAGNAPSRFRPVIDLELCNGCQTCVDRCHFSAVEMIKTPGSKKMKAAIIADNCMGCGLCVFKCPQKAMRLEVVYPPEHIPTWTRSEMTNWDLVPSSKAK